MKKEVIFLHYDWLAWIDWTHLMEMLFIPVCILVASLTIGIMLNKLINRRIENHLNIDEDSWFYIFINALRGVPVSLCLVVGLYWIVNTNTINIIEPLTRLFSYILFTVIILSFLPVASFLALFTVICFGVVIVSGSIFRLRGFLKLTILIFVIVIF